jgi:hypothetical protein
VSGSCILRERRMPDRPWGNPVKTFVWAKVASLVAALSASAFAAGCAVRSGQPEVSQPNRSGRGARVQQTPVQAEQSWWNAGTGDNRGSESRSESSSRGGY